MTREVTIDDLAGRGRPGATELGGQTQYKSAQPRKKPGMTRDFFEDYRAAYLVYIADNKSDSFQIEFKARLVAEHLAEKRKEIEPSPVSFSFTATNQPQEPIAIQTAPSPAAELARLGRFLSNRPEAWKLGAFNITDMAIATISRLDAPVIPHPLPTPEEVACAYAPNDSTWVWNAHEIRMKIISAIHEDRERRGVK